MFSVVVTGGIAMGKSTVLDGLRHGFPDEPVFDADACVSNLLTEAGICSRIRDEFGEAALSPDGSVNRPFLRKQVFDSVDRRAALESILHPEVRERFESVRKESAENGANILFADIPLFFESPSPYPADDVLVVAADRGSQLGRLVSRPGISPEMAERMIAAQLPIDRKIAGADAVIWNSGSRRQLKSQIHIYTQCLKKKT